MTALDDWGEAEPRAIRRRAPFSDNPIVGRRGQQTQQRILDATIRVLSTDGYQRCSIDRITRRAGCSRVSFYQYFSSREDVFQHLAERVARQVSASVEALDRLTPDEAGWNTIRTWVGRYADIFERYGPVFQAFEAAAESADAVAALRTRAADRNIARILANLPPATTRGLDAVIGLLLDATARAYSIGGVLRGAAPGVYPRSRVEDAMTDVFHRALFGLNPDVNVHGGGAGPAPDIRFDPAMLGVLRDDTSPDLSDASRATVRALLSAGREVFVTRGYDGARVDDIVARAELSHGAFYRYFTNKAHLARILVGQALRTLSATMAELPAEPDGAPARTSLRRWLKRYNDTQVDEAWVIRIWVDATVHESGFGIDPAAALDWGRRRLAGFLRPRGFGDVDADAVVMMAVLDAYGARRRSAVTTEAAAHIVETGLLGR